MASIRPGVLVERGHLAGLHPEEHLVLQVRAAAPLVRPPRSFSHSSAAVVHRLPFVGRPPDKLDIVDPRRSRPETTARARVRPAERRVRGPGRWDGTPPTLPTTIDGALVQPLVCTVVDLANTLTLEASLPMVDHVLATRQVFAEMLHDELDAVDRKGKDKAATAIGMGSALSGSPAESLFRVRCRELAAPEYVQQHPFRRPGTQSAIVDFWFPAQGVVVEIDGRAKYEDPAMLDGRSVEDAHWQEKRREDFVRSFPEVRTVVRLSFTDVLSADRVRTALRRAEVPCR